MSGSTLQHWVQQCLLAWPLHFTLIPLRALILQFLRECSSGLPGESGNRFPFLTGLPFGIFSTILLVEGKNVRSMSGEGCDEALMRGNPVLIRTSIYRFSLNKLILIISCAVSYVGQLKIYIHASRFFFCQLWNAKTFQLETHYLSHGTFQNCFLFKTNAMFSDIFWEDPLIYTLCVVMLVAGCEIDVIFVRMKSLPPSPGCFGSIHFRLHQPGIVNRTQSMDWVRLNSAIEPNRTPNFVWVRLPNKSNLIEQIEPNRTPSIRLCWIEFNSIEHNY